MNRIVAIVVTLLLAVAGLDACRGQVSLGGESGDSGGSAAGPTEGGSVREGPDTGASSSGGGLDGGSTDDGSMMGADVGNLPLADGGVIWSAPPCIAMDGGSNDGGAGVPILVATVPAPSQLAIDCNNLYAASYEIGPVFEIPLAGGQVISLDAIGQNNVAINSAGVYTVAGGGGNVPQSIVVGCPKTGCGGNYTVFADGQINVWGVAADDQNVYWTNQSGGAVGKVPVGGGAPTTLASGAVGQVVARGGQLFYSAEVGTGPINLMSVPVSGGAPKLLVSGDTTDTLDPYAADDVNVYFGTTNGAVGFVPIGGGTVTTLVASTDQQFVGQVTVDAANVYWVSPFAGLVREVPIAGGAVVTLATGQHTPIGIAVDAHYVYWANRDDNTVMKVALTQ